VNASAAPALPLTRAYVVCQLIGWTAYAIMGLVITGAFTPLGTGLAMTTVFGSALGGFGTHLFRGVIHRRRWLELGMRGLLPRLLGGALVVALAVELGVWMFGLYATRVYTWKSSTPAIMTATAFNWAFTIILWTSLYTGVHFFQRYRLGEIRRLQLEVAARDAQLSALNAQIHPHFLFNALNSLRALIPEDPARARDLVTELAELMRYALQAERRERVPLAEELAVVEGYLRLEAARFEDRLRWRIDAGDDVRRTLIPPMVLQTLVENAVKHGIASLPEGGTVVVSGRCEGTSVRLRVTNPGRLAMAREGGIGLANVEQRLRLRYDGRSSLTLAQDGEGEVVAEIVLPAETGT
jgi:signal transduction histidine kinase